jgi:HSP20 family protein
MQRQLSSILDDVHIGSNARQWAPAVDIRETDEALLVYAELPGINKKDVTVEVKDGVLSISGERRLGKADREENVHRVERAYGRFARCFSLPTNVNTDKVDATMSNGVLEVRLPKHERAKPKAIRIH